MSDDEKAEVLIQLRIAIAELRKEMTFRFESADKALLLQAKEYDKHLVDLNNKAGQLKEMQATYITADMHKVLVEKVEKLDTFRDTLLGRLSIIAIVVSTIISALVALFMREWGL